MGKSWVAYSLWPTMHRRKPQPRGRGAAVEFTILLKNWKYRLLKRRWFGICVLSRSVRAWVPSAGAEVQYQWRWPEMKKKGPLTSVTGAKHLAPVESELFSGLMPLVEHCAIRQYDDGDAREPGWFTVKTQGAAWLVQVKDPDSACSFTAVGETLDKAFETAALLLSCEEAPWEPDTFLAAARARKKK